MSTLVMVHVESHHLVRERTFRSATHSLREVLDTLKLEHATGRLTINLSQGSVGSIQFEERAQIPTSNRQ